jgi:hypothetical protein
MTKRSLFFVFFTTLSMGFMGTPAAAPPLAERAVSEQKNAAPSRTEKTYTLAHYTIDLSPWQKENPPKVIDPAAECPAHPDFKRPTKPAEVVRTTPVPDDDVKMAQSLLLAHGFNNGIRGADGFRGPSTNLTLRTWEFFYGAHYRYNKNINFDYTKAASALTDFDADMKKFAQNYADIAANKRLISALYFVHKTLPDTNPRAFLTELQKALNDDKTILIGDSVSLNRTQKDTPFHIHDDVWLMMLKNYGAKYGFTLYADAIHYDAQNHLIIDNPILLRHALEAQKIPELALLMLAEHLKAGYDLTTKPPSIPLNRAQEITRSHLVTIGMLAPENRSALRFMLALREAQILYAPLIPKSDDLSITHLNAAIAQIAQTAKADATKFGIADTGALAAIHAAAVRSGLDFGYLMELAQTESGFRTTVRASTSTATGLFQFLNQTWLSLLNDYGAAYGMDFVAPITKSYHDHHNRFTLYIENPIEEQFILNDRRDQALSAQMAQVFQTNNKEKLECFVSTKINRPALYTAHFQGPNDAVIFLNTLHNRPNARADAIFPEAARANRTVFKNGASIADVYTFFSGKFNLGRFEKTVTPPAGSAPSVKTPEKPPTKPQSP